MKYRAFVIKDNLNQLEYVTFRTKVQEFKPAAWGDIMDLPGELFYDVLIRSAIFAGWIDDVVETNEYGENTTFNWKASGEEYLNGLPPMTPEIIEWGKAVFERWVKIRTLDPN